MTPWERQIRVQQNALVPMRLLEGSWQGSGTAHGEPVSSRLVITFILENTMVEVREKTGDHEDISFYRFDPGTGYSVLHLMPGQTRELPVELIPTGGLEWVSGPEQPSVIWEVQGATLLQEVFWPGDEAPEVRVVYVRVDHAGE